MSSEFWEPDDLEWEDDDDPDDLAPECPECKCDLESEQHAWDCSYGDDEAEDEDPAG